MEMLTKEDLKPKLPMRVVEENGALMLKDARGYTYAATTELLQTPFLEALADALNARKAP